MVPLQAGHKSLVRFAGPKTNVRHSWLSLTKLLLDNLEDLLLIELLWETLDSCQGLTTIALYKAWC